MYRLPIKSIQSFYEMDASFYYERLFKSPQSDIRLLRLCFKCTKFIGLTPCTLNKTPLQKLAYVVLTLVITAFLIFYVYLDSIRIMESLDLPDQVVELLIHLSELLFMVTLFLNGNVLLDKNWNKLFMSLYQSELLIKKLHLKFTLTKNLYLFYFQLFIVFIGCLPFHLYQIGTLLEKKEYVAAFSNFGWFFTDIYTVATVTLLLTLSKILSKRYEFLYEYLQNSSTRNLKEEVALVDIKLVLKLYRIYHSAVIQVNTIFGWQIYFYIFMNQNLFISVIEYNLLEQMNNEYEEDEQAHLNVVYCVSYTVSIQF